MDIIQVHPPIPLTTPKGKGLAHFLIDYGVEFNLFWVVFQEEGGECWTWDNTQIRAQKNITIGRTMKHQSKASRLDESLGMRRGKESKKKQSYKARRDESKGARKHPDEKEDIALIKKMVKKKDLKKKK